MVDADTRISAAYSLTFMKASASGMLTPVTKLKYQRLCRHMVTMHMATRMMKVRARIWPGVMADVLWLSFPTGIHIHR